MSKKKLQIFISSTYIDLIEERQAAVQAILGAGHLPAGMELFKAGNDSQFETIKKWINGSDVYMLILGGRYGSIEPKTQKSYTHLEYEYAVSLNKPTFAVVLNDQFLERKSIGKPREEIFEVENINQYQVFKNKVFSKLIKKVDDNKDIRIAILETLSEFSDEYDFVGWIRDDANLVKREIGKKPVSYILHHKCAKCAKEESAPSEFNIFDEDVMENTILMNTWHKFSAGIPGYGSRLDMCNLDFELCDDCLVEIIEGFALKDEIYNNEFN